MSSESEHTYDLPFYYNGDMISLSTPYKKAVNEMTLFGEDNGYQFLWKEATAKPNGSTVCFTWLKGRRFYSITTVTGPNTDLFFVRTGANDPEYYLRTDPGFIIRESNAKNHTFVSAIETHGMYDLIVEKTESAVSSVKSLKILEDNDNYTLLFLEVKGEKAEFRIDYNKGTSEKKWTINRYQ